MPLLSFITDQNLQVAVDKLLKRAHDALNNVQEEFDKNVIDPFAAVFEMAGFQLNEEMWEKNEKARKAQKSLSNCIGSFHQTILGYVDGWEDLGTGKQVDLISKDNKIIAEVKNKHNTVKGSDLDKLYTSLEDLVMPKESHYKGFTAYYVAIIPKRPERYDILFTPSHSKTGSRKPENPLIRKIDGYSFYEKVTGVENALLQLFDALPIVIQTSEHAKNYHFSDLNYLNNLFQEAFGNC